jgi:hypothetical protein
LAVPDSVRLAARIPYESWPERSFCFSISVRLGVGFAFHPVVPARDLEANENLGGGCIDVQGGFG